MLSHRALCSLLKPTVFSTIVGGNRAVVGRQRFANNTPVTATDAAHQYFIAAWRKVAPNMEPPKTPLSFMKARPVVPRLILTKIAVNFVLSSQSELTSKEVDMVIVLATNGQMGILPVHVATIAELKLGLSIF